MKTYSFIKIATVASLLTGPIASTATQAQQAGDLISWEEVSRLSAKGADLAKRAAGIERGSLLLPSRTRLVSYRIQYWTPSPTGKLVRASGLLIVPHSRDPAEGLLGELPVVSFQHGTALQKRDVPSRSRTSLEAAVTELLFGSMGYLVVAADYLGLGDSSLDYHPYLHAATQATTSRDLLIAAWKLWRKLGQRSDGKLYLVGYSQGGHATLALHRELEKNPLSQLAVQTSVPMAGPYALSSAMVNSALGERTLRGTFYAGYVFYSLWRAFPEMPPLHHVMRGLYAEKIPDLFSGEFTIDQVIESLPAHPRELFLPEFLQALQGERQITESQAAYLSALKESDLTQWTPRAPVFFVHASGDQDVPIRNARLAVQAFESRGSRVQLHDLGRAYDHRTGALPALLISFQYIDLLTREGNVGE